MTTKTPRLQNSIILQGQGISTQLTKEFAVVTLAAGADVDARDDNGATAMMHAAVTNSTRAVEALIDAGKTFTQALFFPACSKMRFFLSTQLSLKCLVSRSTPQSCLCVTYE
jgi:ankyrin repeat protein